MRPVNANDLFAAIRRGLRPLEIESIWDKGRGKGSHQSWIFRDPATGGNLRLIIVGAKEISPGVIRSLRRFMTERAGDGSVAPGSRHVARAVLQQFDAAIAGG